jgi:hypothetical protein
MRLSLKPLDETRKEPKIKATLFTGLGRSVKIENGQDLEAPLCGIAIFLHATTERILKEQYSKAFFAELRQRSP